MFKQALNTIFATGAACGLLAFSLPVSAQDATTATLVVAPSSATQSDDSPAAASGDAFNPPMPETNPDQLQFNFTNAPLDAVLDYMGKAGGFVIVKSADVTGTVNIVSHHPINRQQAVDLLNTVLNDKGYAAVSRIPTQGNERPTLKILTKTQAIREGWTPIKRGKDPELIPINDEIVTQIIPISHANAQELINNLQDLLPEPATISANASSNAILLTGPQSSIHRMAQIIEALDESISSISELKVYRLDYAYASEAATMVMSLFSTQQSGRGGGNFNPFFGRFGGGPGGFAGRGGGDNNQGGRGGNNNQAAQSAALAAQQRVTAVADERTNSVIVSAPAEMLPTIEQLLESIDRSPEVNTIVRVFPLRYSSAEQTAQVVTNVFAQNAQTQGRRGGGGRFGGGGGGGFNQQNAALGQRALAEKTVVAVADTRTNSVIVSAVEQVMDEVGKMIAELDENPAKSKKVHMYSLKNANPETVTQTLQDMFASDSATGNRRNNTGATGNARGGNNRNNTNNNRSTRNTGTNNNSNFGSLGGGGGNNR